MPISMAYQLYKKYFYMYIYLILPLGKQVTYQNSGCSTVQKGCKLPPTTDFVTAVTLVHPFPCSVELARCECFSITQQDKVK